MKSNSNGKSLVKWFCFDFFIKKKVAFFLGTLFLFFNLQYFYKNFYEVFLNGGFNADEYYMKILYGISDFSLEKFSSTPSQPYVLLSSIANLFLQDNKMSTRFVSLFFCFFFLVYLFRIIQLTKVSKFEKTFQYVFLFCLTLISSQCFVGTSDFLQWVLIIFSFQIILKTFEAGKSNFYEALKGGVLLGLAICVRPTTLVILFSFVLSLILFYKSSFFRNRSIYLTGIVSIIVVGVINFYPLVTEQKLVLDVKEIPKSIGASWFEMNYLMAKKWDANEIPRTQWLSHLDVVRFKKENPTAFIPKNYLDLLIHEPKFYSKQMIRMFAMANYSNFRYMFLFFPLLFVIFVDRKSMFFKRNINQFLEDETYTDFRNHKVILLTHFLSIISFSFLAIKLFETRWVFPTMILYLIYSLQFLNYFKKEVRVLVYNLSFILGILFFLKNSI